MASNAKWRLFACFLVLVAIEVTRVMSSQEVMTKLTVGFGKVLEQCKTELGVGDHVMQDFFNYWREEYELVHRDLGCVIVCMASKHDLLGDDMRVHHGSTHEFAKNLGADDAAAQQLVNIIQECETSSHTIEDNCSRVLEVAKCFRTKIHQLKWAPSMDVVLGEVMAFS